MLSILAHRLPSVSSSSTKLTASLSPSSKLYSSSSSCRSSSWISSFIIKNKQLSTSSVKQWQKLQHQQQISSLSTLMSPSCSSMSSPRRLSSPRTDNNDQIGPFDLKYYGSSRASTTSTNYSHNNDLYHDDKKKEYFHNNNNKVVYYDHDIYKNKSWIELIRSYLVYNALYYSPPSLLQHGESLLQYSYHILGRYITHKLVRMSFYSQFCAGETISAMMKQTSSNSKSISALTDQNEIGRIYDYSAEASIHDMTQQEMMIQYDDTIEKMCDENLKHFIQCINDAAVTTKDSSTNDMVNSELVSTSPSSPPYVAIKMTALCNPILLYEMTQMFDSKSEIDNDIIYDYGTKNNYDNKDIFYSIDTLLLQVDDNNNNTNDNTKMVVLKQMWKQFEVRLNELMLTAVNHHVRILIDAEQTWYQLAIDNIVQKLQQHYNNMNHIEYPIIYQTYQMYLKDSIHRLQYDIQCANQLNYSIGIKLVRGAYMDQEREYSKQLNQLSPIHDTINDTHENYNNAIKYILSSSNDNDDDIINTNNNTTTTTNDNHSPNQYHKSKIEVMLATHNEESISYAIQILQDEKKKKNGNNNNVVCFAQLYGMMDYMTYQLNRNQYPVYKYITYGPLEMVLPYLLRRAKENSSMLLSSSSSSSSSNNSSNISSNNNNDHHHIITNNDTNNNNKNNTNNAGKEIAYIQQEMIRRLFLHKKKI